VLDASYAERLALIPDSQAKDDGIAVGVAAASRMMLERADDGSQKPGPYEFGMNPGDYIPTPPDFNPICNPEWVTVTPFCMPVGTHYRSAGPAGFSNMADLVASPEYAFQVNLVKELGALNSTTRTEEQTRIAFFWANDVNGTAKPPGQLFDITRVVSDAHALTLAENARLFALVAMAMGDAGIVAWDMKYGTDIDLWRPISAIIHADIDGNDATEADPDWQSLNPFAPAFPAYTSGHATFAGAHAATMAAFFGRDNITFTIDSEDPFYNNLPVHGPRTYHSFTEAAIENGLSRIYLGVHYLFDAMDGNATGFALGRDVVAQFLTPVCRADFNADHTVSSDDFFNFLDAFFADNWRAESNGDGVLNSQDFFDYLTTFFAGC
jgi:membrane-associated phospholipid phosphatase